MFILTRTTTLETKGLPILNIIKKLELCCEKLITVFQKLKVEQSIHERAQRYNLKNKYLDTTFIRELKTSQFGNMDFANF